MTIVNQYTPVTQGAGQTIIVRSLGSHARGSTIDPFLSDEDAANLYDKWKSVWGDPYDCGGGSIAITCEQVADAPVKDFVTVFGKGLAERLKVAAQKHLTI